MLAPLDILPLDQQSRETVGTKHNCLHVQIRINSEFKKIQSVKSNCTTFEALEQKQFCVPPAHNTTKRVTEPASKLPFLPADPWTPHPHQHKEKAYPLLGEQASQGTCCPFTPMLLQQGPTKALPKFHVCTTVNYNDWREGQEPWSVNNFSSVTFSYFPPARLPHSPPDLIP